MDVLDDAVVEEDEMVLSTMMDLMCSLYTSP